eukprot:gene1628-24093_t
MSVRMVAGAGVVGVMGVVGYKAWCEQREQKEAQEEDALRDREMVDRIRAKEQEKAQHRREAVQSMEAEEVTERLLDDPSLQSVEVDMYDVGGLGQRGRVSSRDGASPVPRAPPRQQPTRQTGERTSSVERARAVAAELRRVKEQLEPGY